MPQYIQGGCMLPSICGGVNVYPDPQKSAAYQMKTILLMLYHLKIIIWWKYDFIVTHVMIMGTKFCTCHDSNAARACAKIYSNCSIKILCWSKMIMSLEFSYECNMVDEMVPGSIFMGLTAGYA